MNFYHTSLILILTFIGFLVINNGIENINAQNETNNVNNSSAMNATNAASMMERLHDSDLTPLNGTLLIGSTKIPINYYNYNGTSILQGDIILTKQIVDGRAAMDKFIINKKWPHGEIPYIIDNSVPNKQRIYDAIDYWKANTPIKFKELNNNEPRPHNYVSFVFDFKICASSIGMQDRPQYIKVANWCNKDGLIHEIGHTLGMWHEQGREDRDNYVTVVTDNIKPGKEHNFATIKCNQDNVCASAASIGDYDYCSIMHYPREAFSKIPGEPTIIPKKPITGCSDIGLAMELSEGDIDAIYATYPELE
jgi:hypothetical protein